MSYTELLARTAGFAEKLARHNVRYGDRVIVSIPNGIEFITCYLSCMFGGYTIIPVNEGSPEKEKDYIKTISKANYFVNNIKQVAECAISKPFYQKNKGIFAIFFTSGTTSKPKGVCHNADRMTANADAFNRLLNLDSKLRMLHVMPMGYMAGFLNTVLCPLAVGGTIVIAPRFSAEEAMSFWKHAIDSEVNAVWVTPTIAALLSRLNRSTKISEWSKKNLKYVFCGTAPLLHQVKIEFEKIFGTECLDSYGMSEVQLVSCTLPNNSSHGSAGTLLAGVEIEVKVKSNEVEGNLFVKSPYSLLGYLDPVNGELFSPLHNSQLDTGDIGYMDENSRLFITGRTKDLIIHGGVNVSPVAVENVLRSFTGVIEAAVVGRKHHFWGEEVVAYIVSDRSTNNYKKELIKYCKQHLTADAVPAEINILEALPKTTLGKVQKEMLRGMCK